MADVRRPTWLPSPPAAEIDSPDTHRPRRPQNPRCTLVSVGIGHPFEERLDELRASAAAAGFDRVILWREADFLSDPVLDTLIDGRHTFRDVFTGVLRRERFDPAALKLTKSFRPYCAAFKMVALWRALQQSEPGDYVVWVDASRYFKDVTLQPSLLRPAIDVLRGARGPRPRSASMNKTAKVAMNDTAGLRVASRWASSPWYIDHRTNAEWERLDVGSAFGLLTCSAWDCETDLYTWNGQQQVMNEHTRAALR